jgi:hypothetical protein
MNSYTVSGRSVPGFSKYVSDAKLAEIVIIFQGMLLLPVFFVGA